MFYWTGFSTIDTSVRLHTDSRRYGHEHCKVGQLVLLSMRHIRQLIRKPFSTTDQMKLRPDMPLILSDVDEAKDRCVARLIDALSRLPGITEAHIVGFDWGKPDLCIRYDPLTVALNLVRELVESVGAQLASRLTYLVFSRIEDYSDLCMPLRDGDLDDAELVRAIEATFIRRRTSLPKDVPAGLSYAFATDVGKRAHWRAFVTSSKLIAIALGELV